MGLNFKLSSQDRDYLQLFVKTGRRNSKELTHAYILLGLNNGRPEKDIMASYFVSRTTIWRVKKKYSVYGLKAALAGMEKKGKHKKYRKEDEDELVRLANYMPPYGRKRWTIQLLIEIMGRGNSIKKMNRESVRQILK